MEHPLRVRDQLLAEKLEMVRKQVSHERMSKRGGLLTSGLCVQKNAWKTDWRRMGGRTGVT